MMKRARRVSKKKDKKRKRSDSSESGSSSSTTSEGKDESEEEGPLFEETRRIRRLSERCPGALTAQAIENVREHLLSSRGELHSVSRDQLSPLFSMYAHLTEFGVASALAGTADGCPGFRFAPEMQGGDRFGHACSTCQVARSDPSRRSLLSFTSAGVGERGACEDRRTS